MHVVKERFEAGLSRVIGPALLLCGAGDVFGSSSCAWKGGDPFWWTYAS